MNAIHYCLSKSYHNAGFHTVMAVEKDRDSVLTLRANNEDLKVYDGCIRTFNEDFAKIAIALGRIDHLHFSSPCQDFSMANRSMANSTDETEPRERADLSLLLVDLIKKTSCDTAVFENVVGIWSRRSCRYLHTITAEIIKLGYQVQCTVLRACDYGDPQSRPRFFMLIAKNNVPLPLIPSATHGDDLDKSPYVTVKDALFQVENDNTLSNMEGRKTNLHPGQHGHIRLDGNDVAPTLCASARTPFHYFEDRLITVREAATIQSFPKWYTFQGNITSQYRQVGNAIPVRLATAVANSFRDVLIYEYEEEDRNDEDVS